MTGENIAPLSARDRHLFGPGRKRILALDGGGVRGALSIAFLARLEDIASEIEGKPTRLGDWFDLIGGTSTGAIIAAALALGYSAKEILSFYQTLGPTVFRHQFWRIVGLRAQFDARHLMAQIKSIVGDRSLESDDLRTGLCIVTKRIDVGGSWVLVNNPRSKFWETPADNSFIGNRLYPLANLLRASTAAPHYFDPEPIAIVTGAPPFLFVDGGVSPHNNPSLQLFLIAALPQYGLKWRLGSEDLTIVSIGTGTNRPTLGLKELPWIRALGLAVRALASQISDAQQLVLEMMTWLGDSPISWPINSEIGDLGLADPPGGKHLFRFLRYDVRLEADWLAGELGVRLDEPTLNRYRRMDGPENIGSLYELGAKAAERQMQVVHLR